MYVYVLEVTLGCPQFFGIKSQTPHLKALFILVPDHILILLLLIHFQQHRNVLLWFCLFSLLRIFFLIIFFCVLSIIHDIYVFSLKSARVYHYLQVQPPQQQSPQIKLWQWKCCITLTIPLAT